MPLALVACYVVLDLVDVMQPNLAITLVQKWSQENSQEVIGYAVFNTYGECHIKFGWFLGILLGKDLATFWGPLVVTRLCGKPWEEISPPRRKHW